jgi:hypothetical protein
MGIPLFLGYSNILDITNLPGEGQEVHVPFNDPKRVKDDIGLADVSRALFSLVTTGVRFWPFLLVARDLEGRSDEAILRRLRRIRRNQPPRRQYIGPTTLGTLRPYRSMFSIIKANAENPRTEPLSSFLSDERRTYDGGLDLFERHAPTWKRLLVKSMGKPAAQFACFLREEQRKSNRADPDMEQITISVVERAITRALLDGTCAPLLWQGAAYYAFLRCMYGTSADGTMESDAKRREWAEALLRALGGTKRVEARRLKRYDHAIRTSRRRAPWAKLSGKLRARDRVVLADLRFHVFANLYLRPSPRAF